MGISTAPGQMTSEEIVALSREHTFFSWSAQGAIDPIAIDRAEGVYLYTPEGKRILDFNSQLMSVNIGHGDRRVIDAITAQATKLQYVQPAFATEIRARLGAKLAEILPGDMDKVFFTLGGAEAIENAIKLARAATGRHKILARYRSYHGATLGAMTLTGDPRRWANEPGIVGVVRYPDTHRWGEAEPRPVAESLQGLEDVIRYEGAQTIAAVFLETIVGTNGILIPPDGYIQGVREICDRHDILMVADEVMAGFGRTGRWFAVDHWGVTPDLMTMAKGLTSSYLPLGAVAMRHGLAEKFDAQPDQLSGGQQQRVAIARALAMEPAVLLCDEITSALDPELVGEVLRVVESLADEGMTLLMVTHEMNFARKVSDRLVFMHAGRIHEIGPPEVIFGNPQTPELKQFLSSIH